MPISNFRFGFNWQSAIETRQLKGEGRNRTIPALFTGVKWVNIFFLWRPNLPDEGDNHVLELAVAGGAAVVITHNVSDFVGELKFPEAQIMTPGQFLKLKR